MGPGWGQGAGGAHKGDEQAAGAVLHVELHTFRPSRPLRRYAASAGGLGYTTAYTTELAADGWGWVGPLRTQPASS
jgi:hypothetical protein